MAESRLCETEVLCLAKQYNYRGAILDSAVVCGPCFWTELANPYAPLLLDTVVEPEVGTGQTQHPPAWLKGGVLLKANYNLRPPASLRRGEHYLMEAGRSGY